MRAVSDRRSPLSRKGCSERSDPSIAALSARSHPRRFVERAGHGLAPTTGHHDDAVALLVATRMHADAVPPRMLIEDVDAARFIQARREVIRPRREQQVVDAPLDM